MIVGRYQRRPIERDDERQQVQRERHDPKQRHDGDIGRNVVRRRHERGRGERRE